MTNRIEIDHLTLGAAHDAVMNGAVGVGVLANSDYRFEMFRKGNSSRIDVSHAERGHLIRITVGVQTYAGAGDRDLCRFVARRLEIAGRFE